MNGSELEQMGEKISRVAKYSIASVSFYESDCNNTKKGGGIYGMFC